MQRRVEQRVEELRLQLAQALGGGGWRVGARGDVTIELVRALHVALRHRHLGVVHLGRQVARTRVAHFIHFAPRRRHCALPQVDQRQRQLGRRVVRLLAADVGQAARGVSEIAGQERTPRGIELLIGRGVDRLIETGARVDEVAVFGARRRDGRRSGGRARGEGNRRQNDDPFQISSIAAANVFGVPASSQCTFRSERSQVSCRLAYARVRRLVSATAASRVMVPSMTATASR